MEQDIVQPARRRLSRQDIIRAALFSVAAGLIYVMFHLKGNTTAVSTYSSSAFGWMVYFWNYTQGFGGANYTQGWIIPLVSLWIVWRQRRALAAVPKRVSWAGLAVVVLALLLHWVGAKAQQTRLSLFAFILLLWGIPFYLYGWQTARRLIFPVAFLIFCIPLNFFDSTLFPLRILSVRAATFMLNGLGLDAVSSGSAVLLPVADGFTFDTSDAACSIRMVLAVTAFAAALAYLTQNTFIRQCLLFAISLPCALLANTARTAIIAVVAESFGADAGRAVFAHLSSALTYGAAFALVLGAGILLRKVDKHWMREWTNPPTSP